MKYLKNFESLNYSDKHFGTPIFDYFPWYRYTNSLNSKPKLKEDMWEFYKHAIPNKFNFMRSVWWCGNTVRQQGQGIYVDNPHLITEGGPWLTTLSGSSMVESHTIIVYPDEESVNVDGREFSAESWEDVEKLRLMHNLGKKSLANTYIDSVYSLERIYEILKDAEDDTTIEFDYKDDFEFDTLGHFLKNGYGIKEKQTNEDIVEFIRNYTGNVDFYTCLKKYLTEKGSLTWKQIEAVKKKPSAESLGLDADKICMLVNNIQIAEIIIPLFKNVGTYTIVETGNDVIIY